MKKSLSIATLAATVLLMASSAFAQVPPPPGNAPGVGESPGTGQNEPAPLPSPIGRNTSVRHPDWRVGNSLGDDWYPAMHGDIYFFQEQVKKLMDWSKDYHHGIYHKAHWLNFLIEKYYFSCYDQHGKARWYNYGRCTRGDFNYYYFYWIRPVYYNLLRQSADYYREYKHKHSHAHKVREYKGYIKEVVYKYHRFTKCNYGFNGDDNRAQDDVEAGSFEDDLGVDF
jgi:hypothetical protein